MDIELMKQSQFECKRRACENHIRRLKERYCNVNERLQNVRVSNRKLNCLRWYNNESKEHIIKKLEICIELKELEHEFITEGMFVDGSRVDIVDLTEGVVYEILVSEKEEDFIEKIKNYPKEFRVVKVN